MIGRFLGHTWAKAAAALQMAATIAAGPSPYQKRYFEQLKRRPPIEHSATATRKSAQRGRRRKRRARRAKARAARR